MALKPNTGGQVGEQGDEVAATHCALYDACLTTYFSSFILKFASKKWKREVLTRKKNKIQIDKDYYMAMKKVTTLLFSFINY